MSISRINLRVDAATQLKPYGLTVSLKQRFLKKRWQIWAATLILALAQLSLIFWAAAQIDAGGIACDVYCGQGNLIVWFFSLIVWLALWVGNLVAAISAWSKGLRVVSVVAYAAFATPVVVPLMWILVHAVK